MSLVFLGAPVEIPSDVLYDVSSVLLEYCVTNSVGLREAATNGRAPRRES